MDGGTLKPLPTGVLPTCSGGRLRRHLFFLRRGTQHFLEDAFPPFFVVFLPASAALLLLLPIPPAGAGTSFQSEKAL